MIPRVVAAMAVLPLLSGCAAVVVLPFVAGSALFAHDQVRVKAATRAPAAASPAKPPKRRGKEAAAVPQPPVTVTVTDLKELPPPSPPIAVADDPWQRFFDYAVSLAGQKQGQSALLAPNPSLDLPTRRACPSPHPAVVIDLDGDATFAPDQPLPATPEIVAGLARLRQAGITVLWISQLPSGRAGDVAGALKDSGLDPHGEDQLLLIRGADDRKQLLRDQANEDVCVIAIAGDRRGDFDELFDYLKNPAGAVGLYPMMGSGWFLVPFPATLAASG